MGAYRAREGTEVVEQRFSAFRFPFYFVVVVASVSEAIQTLCR